MPFDPVQLAEIVTKAIETAQAPLLARLAALEARPAPKDGADGQPGPRGEKGVDGLSGAPGERGPEGLVGPEGKPGRDGRDGLPGVAGPMGAKGVDGVNGKDGVDGLGFDDFDMQQVDERSWKFMFVRGERVKVFGPFTIPADIYRGVWQQKQYERGDGVTWGGSEWHCNETTTSKPGEGSAWTLKVKRGRDGKDGKDAPSLPVVSVGATR